MSAKNEYSMIGEQFPPFNLEDENGNEVTESIIQGKWCVIYFYPKDNSPGCTLQSYGFRNRYNEFKELGAKVIGISSDSNKSHKRFKEKCGLPYSLLRDEKGRLYKSLFIKNTFGIIRGRVTFVIDPTNTVRTVISSQLRVRTHASKSLKFLKENLNED